MALAGNSRVRIVSRSSRSRASRASASMLLPFVVYAGPCDGVVVDAAAVRTGKGEGDRRKNAPIRSRFFQGCGDKFISEPIWTFPPYANCSGEFFSSEEVNESCRIEAVMITLLTSCATARRRRGAGKALARRVHWTPRPRRATCRKRESRHATPAKRDHVRMLEGSSA
jgi:hypothetical protein